MEPSSVADAKCRNRSRNTYTAILEIEADMCYFEIEVSGVSSEPYKMCCWAQLHQNPVQKNTESSQNLYDETGKKSQQEILVQNAFQ